MNEINIEWQQRTELLLGKDKMKRLRHAHVLVVGLGGVGAYAAEMICRAGRQGDYADVWKASGFGQQPDYYRAQYERDIAGRLYHRSWASRRRKGR